MNKLFIVGMVGVVGYFGYKAISKNASGVPGNLGPLSKAQPITYAQAGQSNVKPQPRVDNQSQPWYGGNMNALTGSGGQYDLSKVASNLSAGSSIIHSLSDIFGGDEEELVDDSEVGGYEWADGEEPEYVENDYDFYDAQTFDSNDSGMGPMDSYDYNTEVA